MREASHQQTQGIEQVAQAIAQMEKVTQSTAATAEESAAASEELNSQAESSMAVVHGLASMVGESSGSQAGSAPKPARGKAPAGANVTPMPRAFKKRTVSAEEALPLGDTGTYGRF